ncbi:tkt, partial [Symbiodinium natans]
EKEPELAAQFERAVLNRKLPDNWDECLPKLTEEDAGKATRLHSQDCLNAIAPVLPEFMGGSADLAPSNMTLMKCTGDFLKDSYSERNFRFGIREFGMGAVCNALSLDKTGIIPYCATFTIFTDYMRSAIRIAALSQAGTIFVTTHDSIAVGEDGPTHQPIETIPSLRLIPDLTVMRPADGNETAGAYKYAVERSKNDSRPTMMAFSRQALPNLPNSSIENTLKGAYEVVECSDPEVIIIGTGSEVHVCVDAAKSMDAKVRVVSMPSVEVFRAQPDSYKESILPKGVPTLSVEAAVTSGWGEFSTAQVGINVFGASAPGGTCLEKFGFTAENVKACAEKCLKGETGVLSDGSQGKH